MSNETNGRVDEKTNIKKEKQGIREVHNGLMYDIDTAKEIASDRYWDGRNWERCGRNTFLYLTEKGRYFIRHSTYWQGEIDHLEPISKKRAKRLYEILPEHNASYEEAFNEKVEEA